VINNRKIVVVMPAYNAERTLQQTVAEIPGDIVDHILVVDDCSKDETANLARRLGLDVIRHDQNLGYGGNQKTCYSRALAVGADIVIMVHPDYQYTPKLIRAMASMIAEGVYDVVLGSRILGNGALTGGMPLYKYVANRFLTFIQNILINQKLSEYHTGYRAFSADVLRKLQLEKNGNDFIFDNEMLVQCHAAKFRIGEVSCPTHYFEEASSISFRRSVVYGFGCLAVSFRYLLHRMSLKHFVEFVPREQTPNASNAASDPFPRKNAS